MRALILLAGLAVAQAPVPGPPAPVRYRVELTEATMAGGTRTAVLEAERGRYVTKWTMRCMDNGEPRQHPPEKFSYQGQTASSVGFLEGHFRDPYQDARFTVALDSPLWLSSLQGCPGAGTPRIERLP